MKRLMTVATLIGSAVLGFQLSAQDGPYRPVKEIQVGGEGGWDYLNIDSAVKRCTSATRRRQW